MPKQGIEYIIALDGDGEFLTTRVESAHYQEQGPRTSTRSEASLTALQRRHNKSVTLNNENQGPRTAISSEASLTALQRRHNKNVTLDNKNQGQGQGQDPRSCTTSTLPTSNATLWRQPLSDSEIGSTPTGNPSPFAQYVGLGLDQDKVSGTRSMTCKHMFNYVRGIQVREDSAISVALIVDEEVLRNRPRHLESCDVEAVLPKEDFGTEKAGHSLQFANGNSKPRKTCRAAKETVTLCNSPRMMRGRNKVANRWSKNKVANCWSKNKVANRWSKNKVANCWSKNKVANRWSKEKAGHSLQFANGTSKLRKICRVANDTLRLTSHDARTEQTSHDVRTAQTSHDVRTTQTSHDVRTAQTSHDVRTAETSHDVRTAETSHDARTAETSHDVRTAETSHDVRTAETSHDVRTAQTSHDVRTAQTSHDVRTEQSGQLVVQGEGWAQPVVC